MKIIFSDVIMQRYVKSYFMTRITEELRATCLQRFCAATNMDRAWIGGASGYSSINASLEGYHSKVELKSNSIMKYVIVS